MWEGIDVGSTRRDGEGKLVKKGILRDIWDGMDWLMDRAADRTMKWYGRGSHQHWSTTGTDNGEEWP
jgi:hypothetical protein